MATVTNRTEFEGFKLGQWVQMQRSNYRHDRMPEDRIARLEGLDGWVWSKRDTLWDQRMGLLEQYVQREGHSRVPTMHHEEGFHLGQWVATQRKAFQGVSNRSLPPQRIAQLEALPGWSWDGQVDKWEQGFQALQIYVRRTGHPRLPKGQVVNGVRITNWVERQQAFYASGHLQKQGDRVERLESVQGWGWWSSVSDRWERGYAALLLFKEREGHVRVPNGHVEDDLTLWRWVAYQRRRYSQGKIDRDRIHRLEAVDGWWW